MRPNPYEYRPEQELKCNRAEREQLARAIRSFLSGECPEVDHDESESTMYFSDDPVVRHVYRAYCDYLETGRPESRLEWGHLQRLLMLCESRHTLSTETRTDWSASNGIACIGVLTVIVGLFVSGMSWTVWSTSVVFSFVSLMLCLQRMRTSPLFPPRPLEPALAPFESIKDLAVVYQETGFRKLKIAAPHKPVSEFSWARTVGIALTYSAIPLVPLLIAVFPTSEDRATVVLES